MRITRKEARALYELLDEERGRIREVDASRSTSWEKKRKEVVRRLRALPKL